ncbi:MAG: hypothetical protein ACFFCB_01385 [Candidatus Odinarchaeota archaeon]
MDWASFAKRLAITLVICLFIALVATLLVFHVLTFYSFGFTLLFMSVILIIFGICLLTPFVEATAAYRYAVNPPHTRHTMRRFHSRRQEQAKSSIVILAAGGVLLGISLVCLALMILLPI